MQPLLQRAASRAAAGLPRVLLITQHHHRTGPALAGARSSPCPRAIAAAASTNAAANAAAAAAAAGDADDDDAPTCVRARLAPVAGPLAEVLSDALLGFGAQSVSVAELRRDGEAETPIFDAGGGGGGGSGQFWPRCEVVAHFPLEADADAAIAAACGVASGVAGILLAETAPPEASAASPPPPPAADAGFCLPPPYLLAAVANREWVEQIKASYVPLDVVPGVVRIVPEGHAEAAAAAAAAAGGGEEEGAKAGAGAGSADGGRQDPQGRSLLRLVLRPGVAFGTGEHPTTRLCLRAVARLGGLDVGGGGAGGAAESNENLLEGARVLDYGTGSGVLACAALSLGASVAVGTDTDPLAVRASAANARLNGLRCGGGGEEGGAAAVTGPGPRGRYVAVQVPPSLPDGDADEEEEDAVEARLRAEADGGGGGGGGGGKSGAGGCYDLVVANILRGPLLELAPRLARLCAPGGRLLLSGVLAEQAPEIRARYEGLGFGGFVIEAEGSWAALSAVKEEEEEG
jgi:ribosomal protein L11 methylase PrmA